MTLPSSLSDSSSPVPGAGGVVLSGQQVLLVRYQSGTWAFPKGHLEAGESAEAAAVREVWEETGVRARVLAPLPPTHYTNDRGEARMIHWFLMSAEAPEAPADKLEDTFSEGGFVDIGSAASRLSFAEDRELLEHAVSLRSGR